MSGIAVVEMACWDIVGKALGQPVYRLLGGAVRDRVKAYANGWYTVERDPEEFHAAARRVVDRGYRALKLDPFGTGLLELDRAERLRSVALIEAVRDAVGADVEILVEMHGRFTPAIAIRLARELEPFAPAWIEEPVPPENLKALAKVAEQGEHPGRHRRAHPLPLRVPRALRAPGRGHHPARHRPLRRHPRNPQARGRRRDALHAGRPAQRLRAGGRPRPTCTSRRARRTSRSRSTSTTSPTPGSSTSRPGCRRSTPRTAALRCRPVRASA